MGGHEGVDYSKYIKKDPAIERLASMRENLGVYSRMTWGRGISLALKLCIGIPLGYWITVRTTCYTESIYGKEPKDYFLRCYICPANAQEINSNPENWWNRVDL